MTNLEAVAAVAVNRSVSTLPAAAGRSDVSQMITDLKEAVDRGDSRLADSLPKPWDKLGDEGWPEYRAFQSWLSMPKRSLRATATASGLSESAINHLAAKYAWRERAEAHDWWWKIAADVMRKHALERTVQESVQQVAQFPPVIADAIVVARSKLDATLREIQEAEESGDKHPVTLNQLARLLDTIKGLSAELRQWTQVNPSLSVNVNAGTVSKMTILSGDELTEFVRSLADANLIDAEVLEQ